MPGWTSRPLYKPRTRQLGTTAKALYREVLEAFAVGDTGTLHKLCTPSYAQKMAAAISKRDPREKVKFELVKYHQTWRYPKLMSHQIRAANEFDQDQLTEQAVVGISSTQRLTKVYKSTGKIVPGSTRVQDKVEYVVLARNVNKESWTATPWKVWGTTGDTPLEKFLEDKEGAEQKQDKHLKFQNAPKK